MTARRKKGSGESKLEVAAKPVPAEAIPSLNEREFNSLVQVVQLQDLYLSETRARLIPEEPDTAEGPSELQLGPIQTRSSRPREGTLYCGVRFEANAQQRSDNCFRVNIFAEYSLIYEIPADLFLSDTTAAFFARRNAVFNAWPFFRELMHSTAGRMGIPPLLLPVFRLPVNPP